ncbi:ATP-binding protein [Nitrincola sp. MINF-07-Sa-05]|uniref:ATP-binding protein n=1 Tax=Nitrincola salilacus TaxID=3400273 RepID=UPI0039180BA1
MKPVKLLYLPGRVLTPLLLAFIALSGASVHHLLALKAAERSVMEEEVVSLKERLGIEQSTLETYLMLDDRQMVQRRVAGLGMRRHISSAWLIDQNELVAGSLIRTQLEQPLAEVLERAPAGVAEQVEHFIRQRPLSVTITAVEDQRLLLSYTPIHPGYHLILSSDLSQPLAERAALARQGSLQVALFSLLFAMLLAVVLYLVWFRRSRRLINALKAIGSGNLDVRTGLYGYDELAAIGRAVDQMAVEMGSRRDQIELLAELIGRSPVVAFEWKNLPDWPVSFVSDSVVVWGYSTQDFLNGKINFIDIIHPDDLDRIKQEAEGHLNSGPDDYRQEYRIARQDGEWIWVDDRTWLTRNELGEVTRIHGVLHDFTELKEAENQVALLVSDLEQRVEERTEKLAMANKELEAFSYSVSHDLKAPLRGIDGYSQLLQESYAELLDEEGKYFIENIRGGVKQMHQLIEDLLAYSRMERRSLEERLVNLNELVSEVVDLQLVAENYPEVIVDVDVPPIQLLVDKDGLGLVLRNLLSNALKFTAGREQPEIVVAAHQEKERTLISVKDNGVGFDMKYHDRIFQIFQRLHRPEDYAGTGVGLALVSKAMQRMGGRVWAEGAVGKGAIFYLEFRT